MHDSTSNSQIKSIEHKCVAINPLKINFWQVTRVQLSAPWICAFR